MKISFAIFLILFLAQTAQAQDLIVTNDGDSINCSITKVKPTNIYFTFKHKDEIRTTLIPIADVEHYEFDFYQKSDLPKAYAGKPKDFPRFRIAVNGGYSHLIGKTSDAVPNFLKDYIRELKSGYHLGGDVTYFFTELMGVGFKYTQFNSSHGLDRISLTDSLGNVTFGKMSDDLSISFIGPTFSTRFFNYNKSNALILTASLGYMGYVNNKVLIDNYKMTGQTVGVNLNVGYDIGLSDGLSLGLQLSLITGSLSQYQWDDGNTVETIKLEFGEFESVSRVDLTVGLRFSR